jgi:hypothetical protein
LARQESIAFSPAALVWHHRRPTIRGYLKQQRGYGYAEAHLHYRYPGHYNCFGHAVWRGGIYDAVRGAASRTRIPFLLAPRVYQGRFGSAQFQCVYPGVATHWVQLLLTVEWIVLVVCAGSAGLLAAARLPLAATLLTGCALVGVLTTLTAAGVTGNYAAKLERWRGLERVCGAALVAILHIGQPLARAWGRTVGWLKLRQEPPLYQMVDRLYGNLAQREQWLERVAILARHSGWIVRPSCSFSSFDLEILGPGPMLLRLQSAYEENLERGQHYVRYRITARFKATAWIAAAIILVALTCSVWTHFWPMLVPLSMLFAVLARAPWTMRRAISQLAVEAGEALGMPLVRKFSP